MKISNYIKNYTAGNRITVKHIIAEINEYLHEVVRFNKSGMKEELHDIFHFLQLWLYWRVGLDGKVWKITQDSVDKFIKRRKVWENIYEYVGLDKNISKYCGNYKRKEKVIKHLSEYKVSREKSLAAYKKIVLNNFKHK
ncbi:hypothetical protein IPM62_05125 [Candidatus Woesebacteria bacterium]|nr:MAG: hypothetical protein IPM62_05125 [Candidatus Woesebacteria bacterium]